MSVPLRLAIPDAAAWRSCGDAERLASWPAQTIMEVVPSDEDLSFFLRRFAPRIVLRLSPGSVTAVSSGGEVHVPATISYARKGEREIIVAVGDAPAGYPDATTVELFSAAAMQSAEYADLLDKFFRWVLKRLGPSGVPLRPVVIVEGLRSFPPGSIDRQRETIVRALESSGAAAVVV